MLVEEKELLSKMNQELNVKLHLKTVESKPDESENIEKLHEIINHLRQELTKAHETLKNKNQELLQLEFKLSESHKISRRMEQQLGTGSSDNFITQKYEVLLEKLQKIQAEKNQIQNLYVKSSTVISEKNGKIDELGRTIYDLEEKLQFFSQKSMESTKTHNPSNSNLGTSRSTNKSSPKRSKTPGDFLYSKYT